MILTHKLGSFEITNRLERTLERFNHQFMYGGREILLKYGNISDDHYLLGVLQHGVGPGFALWNNYPTPRIGLKRSPLWVASNENESYIRKQGIKNVNAIGSVWSYVKKMMEGENRELKSRHKLRDILFFPAHYGGGIANVHNPSRYITHHYSQSDILKMFAKLRSDFPRETITCCVFWSDLFAANWFEAGEKFGISITSSGIGVTNPFWHPSPSRVQFLHNLFDLISNHKVCMIEQMSSSVFYALSLEKPVFISAYFEKSNFQERELIWLRQKAPKLFQDFIFDESLGEFANLVLGSDRLIEPQEVSSKLDWVRAKPKG